MHKVSIFALKWKLLKRRLHFGFHYWKINFDFIYKNPTYCEQTLHVKIINYFISTPKRAIF